MKTNYVLIDFENVQPANMALLKGGPYRIKVFLGASQGKISLEMAQALQTFGDDAEYIQVVGSGKDALDFHIAFYIGRLSAQEPDATFSIVSRDTGFDPLIKHLKARNIDCRRSASVPDIVHARSASSAVTAKATASTTASGGKTAAASLPEAKPARRRSGKKVDAPVPVLAAVDPGRMDVVLENLRKRKRALPATIKTLRSTIQALFKPALSADDVEKVLAELERRGLITTDDRKVGYQLG